MKRLPSPQDRSNRATGLPLRGGANVTVYVVASYRLAAVAVVFGFCGAPQNLASNGGLSSSGDSGIAIAVPVVGSNVWHT
jgi:hypothetical protein